MSRIRHYQQRRRTKVYSFDTFERGDQLRVRASWTDWRSIRNRVNSAACKAAKRMGSEVAFTTMWDGEHVIVVRVR